MNGLASAEGLSDSSSALVSWADSPGRCAYIRMYHCRLPGMTASSCPTRVAAARVAASSVRSAAARSGEPAGAASISVRAWAALIMARVRSRWPRSSARCSSFPASCRPSISCRRNAAFSRISSTERASRFARTALRCRWLRTEERAWFSREIWWLPSSLARTTVAKW